MDLITRAVGKRKCGFKPALNCVMKPLGRDWVNMVSPFILWQSALFCNWLNVYFHTSVLLNVVLYRRGKPGMSNWTSMVFVHVSKQEVGHWCASVMAVPAAAVFHRLQQLLMHTSAVWMTVYVVAKLSRVRALNVKLWWNRRELGKLGMRRLAKFRGFYTCSMEKPKISPLY